MKTKYIIIDGSYPVVFSDALTHSDVARGFKVTSAGYVNIKSNLDTNIIDTTPYGESESLKLKPAEEDEFILNKLLNKNYL